MISLLLPKAEAEGNNNDITRVNGINWLLPQCNKLRNRFPVIKLPASASIRDIIGYPWGYLCERDLNLLVAA